MGVDVWVWMGGVWVCVGWWVRGGWMGARWCCMYSYLGVVHVCCCMVCLVTIYE